jgi:hypothetical protein
VLSAPAVAQWINYPTPGIPRLPNGKPNLSAPAPKTPDGKPDLSGIWAATDPKYFQDLGASGVEIPTLPWAEALYKERKQTCRKTTPPSVASGTALWISTRMPRPAGSFSLRESLRSFSNPITTTVRS